MANAINQANYMQTRQLKWSQTPEGLYFGIIKHNQNRELGN